MIACWEAKYHYSFWRPNHAIQRADTDGNPATSPDASWLPLMTGNHPEYPSGHGCYTAALTESLRQYFGTKHVRLVALEHDDRDDADVRAARRPRRGRRERPRLGRPALPHDDDADRQGLPEDRPCRRRVSTSSGISAPTETSSTQLLGDEPQLRGAPGGVPARRGAELRRAPRQRGARRCAGRRRAARRSRRSSVPPSTRASTSSWRAVKPGRVGTSRHPLARPGRGSPSSRSRPATRLVSGSAPSPRAISSASTSRSSSSSSESISARS